jgi:type I restriction enzyme, R subunit
MGVIEAKRDDEAHRITKVEEQSAGYATSGLKHIGEADLPFVYESTGEITRFTDRRDPNPDQEKHLPFISPRHWKSGPKAILSRTAASFTRTEYRRD